jgi:hypothetical protein
MGTRVEFDGEKYRFAAGYDHVTSVYFQIWMQPADEQDCAFVTADNQGVFVMTDEDTGKEVEVEPKLARLIKNLRERFEFSRSEGKKYPSMDTSDLRPFAILCGFPENRLVEIEAALHT